MDKIVFIIICFNVSIALAQNDNIYLLDHNGNQRIGGDNNNIIYILNIKDDNEKFHHDSYKFKIPNQSGIDKFLPFSQIRRKISLDTVNYRTRNELSSVMKNYELHEYFSHLVQNRKPINIIIKRNKTYYYFPVLYKGTEKNLEILNYGF